MLLTGHLCRSTMEKSKQCKRDLKNGHFEEHQKKSHDGNISLDFFFLKEIGRNGIMELVLSGQDSPPGNPAVCKKKKV